MTSISRREMLALAAGLALAGNAQSAGKWTEGRHYFRLNPPQPRERGVATLTEIFSYGCPGCNNFLPYMQSLEKKLPARVVVDYLPASWILAENWPVFQRAYLTANALGIARKTHEAMFAAIWKTGELAIIDTKGRPKSPLPSMQDIARFYQRVAAVPIAKVIETSTSFAVESGMKRSDALIKTLRAGSTPTLIVNGMYRVDPPSAGGAQQAVDLAIWLISQV